MKTFYKFCENMQSNISVDTSRYKAMLKQYLRVMAERDNEYAYKVKHFKFDLDGFRHKLRETGFPEAEELLKDVRTGKIKDWQTKHAWDRKLSNFHFNTRNTKFNDINDLQIQLRIYGDQLSGGYEGFSEEDIETTFQDLISKTEVELRKTILLIQDAISRIEEWNSKLQIEINLPFKIDDDFDWLSPQGDSVYVEVITSGNNAEYHPNFTLFTGERGVDVGDVLDAGDTEFFKNSESTSDYFNLISELRRPGSTSQGQIVKLYTARPQRDRQIYTNAKQTKQVPNGLWATTQYNRAVGLALPGELGPSSDEGRDVFEIGVNSRYLILHYDGGVFKDYQLFNKTGWVPIISIRHVH
jgi:hypothetical protein